ncbi:IclR family transcriptional regulator [Paenibacillus sp. J2TS4]|uniref:IclR family transcriptional regulator n=1 Tax=Paenibacillus sp. J2TS4 TaxID=2807194 RepID=UPI001B0E4745|nr:IclR family transcriptional regulator [Paenibacillus sp. J2TS4]GIP35285.1 IclR family transcriptional regulator [Paenibacillus sp. J2TS4]
MIPKVSACGFSRGSLNDLYELSKLPKTSIFMMLSTLEQLGFVHKLEDGKYRPTLKIYNIGMTVLSKLDIRKVARPIMEKMAEDMRFTIHLAVLENEQAMYIEKVPGPGFVQFATKIGQAWPLHNSGVGKALAAWLPEADLDRILEARGMPAATQNTITRAEEFKKTLELVRLNGYALEDEEGETGIRCIAAPIRDHKGEVIAALGATCLRNELSSSEFTLTGQYMKEQANAISGKLGYSEITNPTS